MHKTGLTIQPHLSNADYPYIGRFAPSPTGPLHFGSLVSAVGSYLQAKHNRGLWYVRIEDIDLPRVSQGAEDLILHTLESYGLYWDGPVLRQSQRNKFYQEALDHLLANDLAYPCTCSRKKIQQTAKRGVEGFIYPGTCRHANHKADGQFAIRVKCHNRAITLLDALQGEITQYLETEIGDYVVLRADGYWAYHLAVTVDDAAQKITEVVRGSDLLYSTPRQIYLQRQLGYPTPKYLHLPIATNRQGEKLSKQTNATPLPVDRPLPFLLKTLQFLNQAPPKELQGATLDEFWQWAIQNWKVDKIPNCCSIVTYDQ